MKWARFRLHISFLPIEVRVDGWEGPKLTKTRYVYSAMYVGSPILERRRNRDDFGSLRVEVHTS